MFRNSFEGYKKKLGDLIDTYFSVLLYLSVSFHFK